MQSLDRTLSILRALAAAGNARMRLTDIARASGLSKATATRLLAAMAGERLVEMHDDGKSWRLGPELVYLGLSASRHVSLARLAWPHLEWLAAETGDTCYLTMRSGDDSVCVERALGPYPIQAVTIDVGSRRPLGTGAGSLALLAALPQAEAEEIITRNEPRLEGYLNATSAMLREAVRTAQGRGHAYTESHLVGGVNAVGVAVLAPSGLPVAAVSIAAIAQRFVDGRTGMLVGKLREAAQRIGAEILGKGGPA